MTHSQRRAIITQEIRTRTGIDEEMIANLVQTFYDRVRDDTLIGPVFEERVSDWKSHLQQMCQFWSSVALMSGVYHGQPMPKHLPLPVDARHFDRWLSLFAETAHELCPPAAAEHFIERAHRIAQSLELGIATSSGLMLSKGERLHRPDGEVHLASPASTQARNPMSDSELERNAGLKPEHPHDLHAWRTAERDRLITERRNVPNETRREHAKRIATTLKQLIGAVGGLTVSAYWPIRGEPDLRPLADWIEASGGRFALPLVVAKNQPLAFRGWRTGDPLDRGVWNIPVPANGPDIIPDAVISPVVGFDAEGYRLGYGGGFYDRTLASFSTRPRVIGVGYERARLATIFPQPHDIPMDMIVTQDGVVVLREETGAGIGNSIFNAAEKT